MQNLIVITNSEIMFPAINIGNIPLPKGSKIQIFFDFDDPDHYITLRAKVLEHFFNLHKRIEYKDYFVKYTKDEFEKSPFFEYLGT